MKRKAVPAGRQGFSLVEMVIALSLAVIILGAAFYLLSINLKTWNRNSKRIENLQIVSLVFERIGYDIRSAKKIISVSGETLIIELDSQNVLYDFKNKKIRRKKGETSAYLTDKGDLLGLSFRKIKEGLVEIGIKTESKEFKTEVYCRNE